MSTLSSEHQPGLDISSEKSHASTKGSHNVAMRDQLNEASSTTYQQADIKGGLGLERAAMIIEHQNLPVNELYGAAQREIEATIGYAGAWTDTTREAALRLNQEIGDRPVFSFNQALDELEAYKTDWEQAAHTDKDDWLASEAVMLGSYLQGARQGVAEDIEGALRQVETMLTSGLGNSDEVRGVAELRALRDALFLEKQRAEELQERAPEELRTKQEHEERVETARNDVNAAFKSSPDEPVAFENEPILERQLAPESSREDRLTVVEKADKTNERDKRAENLSPEEKRYRKSIAKIMEAYMISSAVDLGLPLRRQLTAQQRSAVTELMRRYSEKRIHINGAKAVNEQLESLRKDVRAVFGE